MTTQTWIGSNGDWGDSTNWTASGGASAVGTAAFGNNGAITVTGYATPDVIELDNCNVTLNGSFDADPGQGAIDDGSAASPSSLTIATFADVAVSQISLSNTDFVVNGGLLADGGSANIMDLEGPEALVAINDSLSVGILLVKNGATFLGNMSLGNGMGLHEDDQSTVAQGTISETGSSQIYVSSTVDGAQETVQLSDDITLGNNGTLNVSGDPGITVALTGAISGSGTLLTPGSNVAVDGTVEAAGGTLTVGSLSGDGTLTAAIDSDLVFTGSTTAALTAVIASGGTLTITTSLPQFGATIDGFATGDSLIVPFDGATAAQFLATAPGTGVLTLLKGSQSVGQLLLSGVQAGENFNVTSGANGQTVVTVAAAGNANSVQQSENLTTLSGPSQPLNSQILSIAPYAQSALNALIAQNPGGNNEWFLKGDTTVVGGAPSFGLDLEVVGAVAHAPIGQGFGPGANITLTPGYHALIAEGDENINLLDSDVGNSLIVGNQGSDILVTSCNNDTLVGATGANTTFFAGAKNGQQNVTIQGGGNDIISSNENSYITTSSESSKVFLGAGSDTIVSSGHDEIVCGAVTQSTIVVSTNSSAQDTVFGPQTGSILFTGSTEADTLVGSGGAVTMSGGASDGNVLWSGASNAEYLGGKGSATIVGGSGNLQVSGGVGAVEVWAGSGNTTISGAAGNSIYIVGEGASTVFAASGNTVWVEGKANVNIFGASGVDAYGGNSFGNDIFHAAAGSETLWGGAGNDTFVAGNAGAGESYFVSGSGHNVFDFMNGATGGASAIFGFVQGQDIISLSGYGDSVPAISVNDGSSFFRLGDGSQVEVFGVTNLGPSAFQIS